MSTASPSKQLQQIRWAVRGVLVLGVAASVTANVLHALPNLISQTISAWPPLAFLITVEVISRVPVYRKSLAGVRLLATTAIAGIAAWVSYWHMAAVAGRYGEGYGSAHLLPFSVDGLIVIASVSLVELAGRIRTVAEPITQPVAGEPPVAAEEPALDVPEPVLDDVLDERSPKPTPATPKIARVRKRNPAASKTEVATKAGVSLATVRRQWPITEPSIPEPVGSTNGAATSHLLRSTD